MDTPYTGLILPYTPEFKAFPKIPRYKRYYIITEKIDGTNACVIVGPDGAVFAQSRKRLISPGKGNDNYGFAEWVQQHADELRDGLGEGYHYGEWWGVGVNRAYGLSERRFSLFNTGRWNEATPQPECCHVVPVLCTGHDDLDADIRKTIEVLRTEGSVAAAPKDKRYKPFMQPEGIVVYHTASGGYFKILLENDEIPKGAQ